MRKSHKQVLLKIKGKSIPIWVDSGIFSLLQAINGISGVATNFSCQGGESGSIYTAYVSLTGKKAKVFCLELLKASLRKRRQTSGLVFDQGNGYIIRWHPDEYGDVLHFTQLVAAKWRGKNKEKPCQSMSAKNNGFAIFWK